MNWKLISLGGLGAFCMFLNIINDAANRQLSIDSQEKAKHMHNVDTENELNEANKNIKLVDDLNKRENKTINDKVNSWKKLNNYETRKRDVHRFCENELVEFKDSINYYEKKQTITDAADDELEAFKDSIDYDYEVDAHEKTIEEAKSLYKKKCKLYDIAGNDDAVSEDANSMKAKAKVVMDDTVKAEKAEIAKLKQKVEEEKNKINRKKQTELRELEYELQSTKTRLAKQENEAIEAIDKEYNDAKNEIRESVVSQRTEEEITALEKYEQYKERLNDQRIADADCAMDIYNNTPKHERIAAYLNSCKCPKWFAVFIGALPMVPAGYLCINYAKFVYSVIKAM